MSQKALNVLFLCTHNSARSIIAEALLNSIGGDRFRAYSAGSHPKENQQPNPIGLQALKNAGISTENLHSKSWDIFAQADSPSMDLIITVCDNAAGEICPIWPGHPATAHWGYTDPSEGEMSEAERSVAFGRTVQMIKRRLDLFISLPSSQLEKMSLETTARALASK
jgi:protein-tyrosine-phosphatase